MSQVKLYTIFANLHIKLFFKKYPKALSFRKLMWELAKSKKIKIDRSADFQAILLQLYQLAKKKRK